MSATNAGRRPFPAAAAALLWLLSAASALALPPECPTWFPDLRCDRSGRYPGFSMPIQMPYLFEDPFITTGLYGFGIYHEYPDSSAFEGGQVWIASVQARLAITDRLAFIATKDGYVFHDPDNPILPSEDGFWNITPGLKYALIDMPEKNFILSPSFRVEIPTGQQKVFNGYGDGVAIPAVSTAWGKGPFHTIADFGSQIPFDTGKQSTSLFWNLHLDWLFFDRVAPMFEIGGLHYVASGNGRLKIRTSLGRLPVGAVEGIYGSFEGVDAANLGSAGVRGNDIVVATFGARVLLTKHVNFGVAYGYPLTDREDIWNRRVTMNLNFEL
jgi:hypothetical protein